MRYGATWTDSAAFVLEVMYHKDRWMGTDCAMGIVLARNEEYDAGERHA